MPVEKVKVDCNVFREAIKNNCVAAAAFIKELKQMEESEKDSGVDKGEMIANAMLAFRHLEDAAMRFGKVIQAADGGVSPLGGPNSINKN